MSPKASLLLGLLVTSGIATAQYYEPEFQVPWIGYEVNVYPKGIEIWDVAGGDFDLDGNPDFAAVSWYPNPELSIVFGDGRGGYLPPIKYPIVLGSLGVEAADFDRDGDLDIALSDTGQFWEGASFSLFRNERNRQFTFAGSFPCGRGPSGIATGDFNGDGRIDVAVAHDDYIVAGHSIAVVLGDGLGSFSSPTVIQMPSGTYDIEAADYDVDGLLDLVVGHEGRRISLVRNVGNGAFAGPQALTPDPLGSLFREPDLLVADPDRDGDPDLLFSGAGTVNTGAGFVNLFRNGGAGTFGPPERIQLPAPLDGAPGMAVHDLDADGALDLLAADGYQSWTLLRGDGAGGFLAGSELRSGWEPFRFVAGDLDLDRDPDVVVVARSSMEACVYLNDSRAGFRQPAHVPMVDPSRAPVSSSDMRVADLDRDGHLDFVVGYSANFIEETGLSVRRGRGDGTLGPIEDYRTPLFPSDIALGDLDGDGDVDVAWIETSFGIGNPSLRLKLNDGTGAFGATRTVAAGPRGGDEGALEMLDVDGDADLDLVASGSLFDVLIYRNLGGATFAGALVHTVSTPVSAIGGGDFDGDGDLDLATNTGVQGYFEVSLGNGSGTFAAPFTETSGRGVNAIAVADVNRDGHLDLSGGYALDGDGATVLLGRGDGTFRPERNYYGSYSGATDDVTVTDVDRDGWLDVLVANHASQDVSYWRNAGDGTFERQRRYGVGQSGRALNLADHDGDGVDDLAVQVEPDSPVNGWYYPALTLLAGKARGFRDAGFGLPGAKGLPLLAGVGPLTPGRSFTLGVERARGGAPLALVFGSTRVDLPFAGGSLVPLPEVVIPLATDTDGKVSLDLPWPADLGPGTTYFVQGWVLDAAGPQGLAATNGLQVTRL
jgi:hypothetical protein